MSLHLAVLGITTLGIGWVMTQAGVSKSALEWRQRRRVCPSCGRNIETRVCSTCCG